METPAHGHLIQQLTHHYFGKQVAAVTELILKYDQVSLKFMKTIAPNIKFEDIKRSLLILVKYQLVDYVKTFNNLNQNFEYSIVPERVFFFFRIPRFIHVTSKGESQQAADAISILAAKGIVSQAMLAKNLIELAQIRRKETHITSIVQEVDATINSLIHRKYLAKMSDNICLNLERFNRHHRHHLIVNTLSDFFNREPEIEALSKVMLEISAENTSDEALITAPVPMATLKGQLCPKTITEARLEQLMTRLTTESSYKFFISSGTHPQKGQMYAINIGLVVDHLVKEHLCSMITARYGPKCCRVFRVLLQRGPLLLKQIEEFIMLPTKDVREYSYMLIKDGLVRNRQVPKTLDNAPGKSVFIMSVDMDQVVFKIADMCCRTQSNLLARHEYEQQRNKTLLEKAQAVRNIISSADEHSLLSSDQMINREEWAEYFSTHELSQLDVTRKNLDRLLLAKNQADETLFLAHAWLKLRPNMS